MSFALPRRAFAALLALAAGSAAVPPAAHAAEGMWTLDNLPAAAMQQRYGFTPSPAFVDKAMRASVRLAGGCSGSFVSREGLVMTNHHCANECVQQVSTKERDYMEAGFLAKTRAEEPRCPTIELNRLERITDVTARIGAATAGKQGEAFAAAKKAERAKLEAECVGADAERARCDVVELYHGGRYALYRYHRFSDVRLAFAPEKAIAYFGGDPDNFEFPRYDLDLALLRAYEDGKPAVIADYFPFSPAGAEAGEPVFVTGHPGSTQRQLTVAQLEAIRDVHQPSRLLRIAEARGLLTQYASTGAEAARVSQKDRFGIENSYKALMGQQRALVAGEILAAKSREEAALKTWLAGPDGAALRRETGDPWAEIAAAERNFRDYEVRYRQLEGMRGLWSDYFTLARTLVRGAAERAKPNDQRLREFTQSALPSTEQALFSAAPIEPAYEKVKLAWSLTRLREALGVGDPTVRAVLGNDAPETVAARLVDGTRLGDVAARRALWEGGATAVAASTDPFVVLARTVDADARAQRKRYEDELEAVASRGAERIARLRFAKEGTGAYPDATFTLRLSYGEVKGWQEKGATVAPFTTFAGAFDHHTGAEPFALPASWLSRRTTLDPAQRFDFVTTHDIIGGNSGSPMINRRGEVVGLIFDGNVHSLGGAYAYDETSNRAVAVHSGAIVAALRQIYGAGFLADELGGKAK